MYKFISIALLLCVFGRSESKSDLQIRLLQEKLDAKTVELSLSKSELSNIKQNVIESNKLLRRTKLNHNLLLKHSMEIDANTQSSKVSAETNVNITKDIKASTELAAKEALNAKTSTDRLIQPLWASLCLGTITTLGALFGWLRLKRLDARQAETHDLVLKVELSINSRMDALLISTEKAALAKGTLEEKQRNNKTPLS